jgi:hypothetical protein
MRYFLKLVGHVIVRRSNRFWLKKRNSTNPSLSLKKRGSEKRKFYKSYLDLGVLFRKPSVSGGAGIRE